MLTDVGPNFICRPYRGVSVQDSPVPLDAASLRDHLLGRPVYRRTEFLVMVRDGARAVVQVGVAPGDDLFRPVAEVRCLAGPDEVAFVHDERVDTANASQMARAALYSARPARICVVQGRFQHVNFIVEPAPLRVRLVEVVPPEPPKLLEMARRVADFDEELPPMAWDLVPIDVRELAAGAGADRLLFPCRCAGLELDGAVDFLDACPPGRGDWTLVGCERSRQIHRFLYGADPPARVDLCPRVVDPGTGSGAWGDGPTLMKCCLLERGLERDGARTVVPWGATLEEVRDADLILAVGARLGEAT
ncbi:MAG: hypothetical protein KY434_10265, partial [Actinobacteria bacterium]|nr:hypothetical protein [Actinomycetota bacterium]